MLTQAQIDFFHREGYLAIDSLVPEGEIPWLREIYDRLFAQRAGRSDGNQFDLGGTDEEGKEPVLPQILNPKRYAPELANGKFRENALAVARQLLGPDVQAQGEHAILKPARYGAATPWHQDEAYWASEYDYHSISIWIPLQDATLENGCMQFIPRSHKLDVQPHHTINNDPRIHGLEADSLDTSTAVPCPIPAGGATIHPSRTFHHAGPNRSDSPRRAYILGFGTQAQKRSTPRDFNWNTAKQTPRGARRQSGKRCIIGHTLMPDIILTTLNARYAHASFGLRYLRANLPPDLFDRSEILEFDINQRTTDLLESLLSRNPKIIGLGVYIWNADAATHLAAQLKRLRPDIFLILGGPEISYETDEQEITRYADYVITGEADLAFADLCQKLLAGQRPLMKIIPAPLPEFTQMKLPYDLYDAKDIKQRVVYVEASRGCPFKCEFCLSSLDIPVRNVSVDAFLAEMQKLLDLGLRQFKFVDRTFNLNLNISKAILQFFHDRFTPGLFLHFEMIPDRLPDALRQWIAKFPPGALQFEVGIQTFNEDVADRISRKQDNARIEDNFRFLRTETGVHIHADLIAGLPGEDLASFAAGFDKLVALRPQEIQVGLLKRLRGTPIVRHDAEWQMLYSPHAPYEVLQTRSIDFATMQRLRRFSRYWDLIANSGNFRQATPLIWQGASPFYTFLALSDWLHATTSQSHGIALQHLAELLFRYLTQIAKRDPEQTALAIWSDYQRAGRSDRPAFLKPYISDLPIPRRPSPSSAPRRQARHLT